jgi:hypothetical protein
MGIDATHKGLDEGTREWPEEIVMSDEIRALVDRRWAEYGIGSEPRETNGKAERSLRLFRRSRKSESREAARTDGENA